MAQILCKKHGIQSPAFTSEILVNKVLAGISVDAVELKQLTYIAPLAGLASCIVDKLFLDEVSGLNYENDEDDGFELACRLKPVCGVCFDEWLHGASLR